MNGGSLLFDWIGSLTFLPLDVHGSDNSLDEILYLKYVKNILGVRVTMDILIKNDMIVILKDGTVLKFKECGLGL